MTIGSGAAAAALTLMLVAGGAAAGDKPGGVIFSTREEMLKIGAFRYEPPDVWNKELPDAVDLSPLVPREIGDQGTQNSCVGWAIAYYARTLIENESRRKANGQRLDNVASPFSPSFIYNMGLQQDRAQDCNDGMKIEQGLSFLKGFGALPSADFRYDEQQCSRLPTVDERQRAMHFTIREFGRIETLYDLKGAIAQHMPVVIGIQFGEKFRNFRRREPFVDANDGTRFAHAITVVGYDDSRKAVKVVNSWGADWGDKGFAWIDYQTLDKMARVEGVLVAYALFN